MNGKQAVLSKFDFNCDKKVHWKIYYGYSPLQGNLCASTEVIPGELDKNLSRERLSQSLDLLTPGEYLIQFRSESTSNNNNISHRFEIKPDYGNNSQPQQNNNPALNGFRDAQTVQTIIAAEIGKVNAEWQTKMINRELEEIREGIEKSKGR